MEKLGHLLAIWIHRQRTLSKKIESKARHLSLNRLSALIVIISFIPLTLLFFISGKNYTWLQILAYYIFQLIILLIALVFVIGWFKAKEMANADVEGFSFVKLSFKKLDNEYFGFDDSDIENLEHLTNHLPSNGKIIIREIPKNKQSGNLRFLFSFLDHIIEDGIQGLGKESRESLSNLVQKRFSFEGSEINLNTFASSYSKWSQKTKERGYEDTRKAITKALGRS